MQNEPNFTTPPLIFCVTNLLTYCVTNLLSYSFMQNEPNFTLTAHMPNSPNGPRVTGHESRINMQNKPNFTTPGLIICVTNLLTYCVTNLHKLPIYEKRTQFYPQRTDQTRKQSKFYPVFFAFSLLLFTFILILLLSFLHFSQLFVTFYKFWTKTHLTTYTTKAYITFHSPNTLHPSRNTTYEKMQNEANFSYTHSLIKQKMKNKPNLLNAQSNLSEVVLISRPWRIPKNHRSSIINGKAQLNYTKAKKKTLASKENCFYSIKIKDFDKYDTSKAAKSSSDRRHLH